MQICVVGWYYWDNVYERLASSQHVVTVVAHRHHSWLEKVNHVYRENVGLEFGAYNHYLMSIWEKGPVVWVHDDVLFSDKAINKIDSTMKAKRLDHAYVWGIPVTMKGAGHQRHGRMMALSDRFMRFLKENGGVWYDLNNKGFTISDDDSHNIGIYKFDSRIKKLRRRFRLGRFGVRGIKMWRRGGEGGVRQRKVLFL